MQKELVTPIRSNDERETKVSGCTENVAYFTLNPANVFWPKCLWPSVAAIIYDV